MIFKLQSYLFENVENFNIRCTNITENRANCTSKSVLKVIVEQCILAIIFMREKGRELSIVIMHGVFIFFKKN